MVSGTVPLYFTEPIKLLEFSTFHCWFLSQFSQTFRQGQTKCFLFWWKFLRIRFRHQCQDLLNFWCHFLVAVLLAPALCPHLLSVATLLCLKSKLGYYLISDWTVRDWQETFKIQNKFKLILYLSNSIASLYLLYM